MKSLILKQPAPIEQNPLRLVERMLPEITAGHVLLRVEACGVCHTDLHIAEGDIHPPGLPVTPGHQVVGVVAACGAGVSGVQKGERVGVAWFYGACGDCDACRRGEENLCAAARFTGFDVDGGFAEYMLADVCAILHLPNGIETVQAAPLLCAGIIGYRSLHKADVKAGERLGLFGFGASAHLTIQVARHWGCEVYAFSRSDAHRRHALELGAAWAGRMEEELPVMLDRGIIFAPAGALVPQALRKIRPGGTLAINAVSMTDIPQMPYDVIYGERTLRSVANATRRDGVEFLKLAAEIGIHADTVTYELEDANRALQDIKHSRIKGEAVLVMG